MYRNGLFYPDNELSVFLDIAMMLLSIMEDYKFIWLSAI